MEKTIVARIIGFLYATVAALAWRYGTPRSEPLVDREWILTDREWYFWSFCTVIFALGVTFAIDELDRRGYSKDTIVISGMLTGLIYWCNFSIGRLISAGDQSSDLQSPIP
jgi:hypothetical protein